MRFGRFLVRFVRPFMKLLFPCTVIGAENIPEEKGTLLCCNHVSLMDPVYLLTCQRRHVYFMAKEELMRRRFTKWLLGKQLGVFSVARGKADTGALVHAEELLESGKMVGIFPEGTRSKTGSLGRIKSGAAVILSATNATLLPVCILTKNQKVRLFRRTKVVFGKPIAFEDICSMTGSKADLKNITRRIQRELETLMEEYR